MKTNDLKLFAIEYINLQENLSRTDKIELMEWAYYAEKEELISLLFTGQARTLEEGEGKFVQELFDYSNVGGFLKEALSPEEVLFEDEATWNALKQVLKTGYEGSSDALKQVFDKHNVAAAKQLLKTAVEKNTPGAKNLWNSIKVGKLDFGSTGFSVDKSGAQALKGSGVIKKLASKWASFRAPDSKELPAWLAGAGVRPGEAGAAWGKNYNQAIEAMNTGAPIAAAVVAALVLLLARKLYKSHLSKAGKACKDKKGAERDMCVKKFKANALKAQVSELSRGKQACQAASNPGKCTAKIDQKIQKKKMEAQKMMSK